MCESYVSKALRRALEDKEKRFKDGGIMCEMEMPRYVCHKRVHALEIERVEYETGKKPQNETDGGAFLFPKDNRFFRFLVGFDFVQKHNPQAGGYYVVYEDGYKSFSPKKAFEDGYSLENT